MFVIYLKIIFKLIDSIIIILGIFIQLLNYPARSDKICISIIYPIHNTCTILTTEFCIQKDYSDVTFHRENIHNSETPSNLQQESKNVDNFLDVKNIGNEFRSKPLSITSAADQVK